LRAGPRSRPGHRRTRPHHPRQHHPGGATMRRRSTRLLAALLVLTLVAAACGRDDDSGDTGDDRGDGEGQEEATAIPTENCATDPSEEIEGDVIRLVSSYPQSGLTAAFSEIARG